MIKGDDRDSIDFTRFTAYVEQEDILLQTMTVRECLLFAARMKLNPKKKNIDLTVDTLLDSLKLTKSKNTLIGGPLLRGVSGGERKRTSIGVELITEPSLLFLDEPTTGLDSFTSENIVDLLKDIANSGRTVTCTIHQPNSEMFSKFDQLMLMAQGHMIYHSKASKAVKYFSNIGFECPETMNPADFFMNIISKEGINEMDNEPDNYLA